MNNMNLQSALQQTQNWLRNMFVETTDLAATLEKFNAWHGIRGKTDGDLIILDYDQINVKWSEPFGHVCRGLILDAHNFNVIAFGLPKFFNLGESNARPIDWSTARVQEKLDGSMVQRFWNPYTQSFQFSTRYQLPRDMAKNDVTPGVTWESLVLKAFDNSPHLLLDSQPSFETWVLEVMTPLNRVVIPHKSYSAKLLTIRDLRDMQEVPFQDEDSKIGPRSFAFKSEEETVEFAKTLDGSSQEGFVVVDANFNRVKVKGQQYVQLHRLKDGVNSVGAIINLAKNNDFEEVIVNFPEFKKAILEAALLIENTILEHERAYEELKALPTQKDFALAVQGRNLSFSSALFLTRAGKARSVRESIMNHRESGFIEVFKNKLGLSFAEMITAGATDA